MKEIIQIIKIKVKVNTKNILNDLNSKLRMKFKKSEEYDFVGIGNPILSKSTLIDTETAIRGLYKEFEENDLIDVNQLQYFIAFAETEWEILQIQKNFEKNKTKLFSS